MTYLLGVDLGSTSLKGVLYDTEGNVVASGSRPTLKSHPAPEHPEWTVWQPEQIWGDTAAAVREAVSRIGDPRQIAAVAVTGMGMDGLPVDADGRPLAPMISWHDPRTQPQHAWWLEHIGAAETFAVGGNPVWPINSALRILWMRQHQPEVMARADRWLLIEDFVNFMLCGRQVTDYSMASCTLLFDQRRLDWSESTLARSGIERRLLCEALPSGTRIGAITRAAAEATGLAEGTPVVLGGHDHICGALPVGAFRPGVLLDVTGTWESVLTATEGPVLRDELRTTGMTVQAHVAPGMHVVWGGCVAGEMLEWFRRSVGKSLLGATSPCNDTGEIPWEPLLAAAASSPPGAHGAMFLPHMSGANCPVVDPRSLGAWFGLSPRTEPADLLRAVFEGLDYQFRDIVEALESSLAARFERIVAVGGATRNAFWMQNKADVLGRPVEVPGIEEATPLGAAMLAGVGVGVYRDLAEAAARVGRPARVFQPNAAHAALYAEGFALHRELYAAAAGIHHRLFDRFVG